MMQSQLQSLPFVEIVEEPAQNLQRFRYSCESRPSGFIVGANSTPKKKTFPSIKVHGYKGPSLIIVSCVTKDEIPMPHPHGLVGRSYCENGICRIRIILNGDEISFRGLGVQCTKKKQVQDALKIKKEKCIDPFNTGFEHMKFPDKIDLNAVRLAFQVFIPGPDKQCNVALQPVATVPFFDKRAAPKLVLLAISHDQAPVSGGMEMILLCEKIAKHDIQIRFLELHENLILWDGYGKFKAEQVHKQAAIAFETPRYCNQNISEPVDVLVQLRRKSDGATSNTFPFQLMPLNLNHSKSHDIQNLSEADTVDSLKRKRMEYSDSNLLQDLKMQKQNTGTQLIESINQQQHSDRGDIEFPQPRSLSSQPNPQPYPVPNPQPKHRPSSKLKCKPKPQPRRIESPPPNVTIGCCVYEEPRITDYRQEEPKQTERHSANQGTLLDINFDDPFDLLDGNVDELDSQDLNFLDNIDSDILESLSEKLSKGLSISDQIEETHQSILSELNKDLQAFQQQQQQQQLQQQQQQQLQQQQQQQRQQQSINFNALEFYDAFSEQTFGSFDPDTFLNL